MNSNLYTNPDTAGSSIDKIDQATHQLIKLRALADLLSNADPIELEDHSLEGVSLMILDCTEALRTIITSRNPEKEAPK